MTKENIFITTSGEHKIEFLPFINGYQALELADIHADTPEKRSTAITKKGIELLVVSVDGVTENCLDAVLKLEFTDYMEVREKIDEIASLKKKVAATTSDTSSKDTSQV